MLSQNSRNSQSSVVNCFPRFDDLTPYFFQDFDNQISFRWVNVFCVNQFLQELITGMEQGQIFITPRHLEQSLLHTFNNGFRILDRFVEKKDRLQWVNYLNILKVFVESSMLSRRAHLRILTQHDKNGYSLLHELVLFDVEDENNTLDMIKAYINELRFYGNECIKHELEKKNRSGYSVLCQAINNGRKNGRASMLIAEYFVDLMKSLYTPKEQLFLLSTRKEKQTLRCQECKKGSYFINGMLNTVRKNLRKEIEQLDPELLAIYVATPESRGLFSPASVARHPLGSPVNLVNPTKVV